MEHYFDNHDALNDLKRLKTNCKHLDNQWGDFKKIVEEKDIDCGYQHMLRSILVKAELYEQHEREIDNVIIIDEEDNDCVLENNPQYELFLRGLKEHDKSYVEERENNGVPLYIKYEDELKHERSRKMKHRVEKVDGPFNQNHSGFDVRALCIRECKVQSHRKLKGKNIVKVDNEDTKPIVRIDSENFYWKRGRGDNRATGGYCKRVERVKPGKKDKMGPGADLIRGDNGLLSREIVLRKYAAKDCLDHNAKEAQLSRKRTHCDFRNVKAESSKEGDDEIDTDVEILDDAEEVLFLQNAASRKRTHCDFRDVKAESSKEGDDEIDTDVEILDDDAFRKNRTSFVPSKKVHKSMEEDTDIHRVGSASACNGFRKQVLDVIRKPFDNEELKRLREAVRDGSYYHHYPDLERKLKRSRYKRGKCLNIFRGFFFWLQNVSQEGAFKPWKDGQCLAVQPGPPKNSPPPLYLSGTCKAVKTRDSEVNLYKGTLFGRSL